MTKYRKLKIIVLLMLLIGNSNTSSAQANPNNFAEMVDFMPPPPDATAIIKNGMVDVNKNSGAPNVSIPVYTLKGQKLSTTVSLNYNSTGIKVDDVSGRVGMGWSLNAGGVVTRTLRGSPDESSTRISPPETFGANCDSYTFLDRADRYYDINSAGYDAQPDLFNFNMNGLSGSFVMTGPYTAMSIDPEKFSIAVNLTSGAQYNFIISTPDGIKYYFGGTGATEKTKKNSYCGRDFSQALPNAWYLVKIVHPNDEVITFGYKSHSYKYDTGFTETMTWGGACGGLTGPTQCGYYMQTEGKQLSFISNSYTGISFTYTARPDNSDSLVSEIRLSKIGTPSILVGKFILSYTTGEATNSNFYSPGWSNIFPQYTPYLTGLKEESSDAAYFRQHTFSYITPNSRPKRLSYSQDHWGYYNGQNNTTLLPPPADPGVASNMTAANAVRTPSETHAKMGLLETITYPTGGTDVISYGINKYYNSLTATHEDAGGLRVTSITTQNPGQSASIKKYYYGQMSALTQSSLHTVRKPVYEKNFLHKYSASDYCEKVGLYSNSLNTLNTYQNSPISYEYVTEGIGNNFEGGSLQTKFMVAEDVPANTIWGSYIMGLPMTNTGAAYNGKVLEETIYKDGGSGLYPIKKTANQYYTDSRGDYVVKGYVVNHSKEDLMTYSCPLGTEYVSNFDVFEYQVHNTWVYLKKTTETNYDELGLNPLTKITEYFRDNFEDHKEITRIETTDGAGNTLKTTLKYPVDYIGSPDCPACGSMIGLGVRNPVISFKQTKTGVNTPVMEVLTAYSEYPSSSGNFAPSQIKKSTQGSGLISEGTFDNYDAKGNLLQYTDKTGIVNTIIWGYNHLYPVAKITGANYASVVATLTGGNVTALQTMDGESLRTELNKIRTGLPAAFVTTYTYQHLAGVTSITDPNNKRSTYQYDSFNRLALVRDQEGKILKRICYNYQGQVENCTAPCLPEPIWENTSTPLRCGIASCAYTGYMQQEQQDKNPCSATYNTTRWENVMAAPPSTCTGTLIEMTGNNQTNDPMTIVFTDVNTGVIYTLNVPPLTNGPIGCIPPGTYNVYMYRTTGIPSGYDFWIGTNLITGYDATFYNIAVSGRINGNRTVKITMSL